MIKGKERLPRALVALALTAALALAAAPAQAVSITFSGSSGNLAASATFEIVSEGADFDFLITLTNTSIADVTAPSQVLTGVFFSIAGDPTLNPYWAMVPGGSSVLNAPGSAVSGSLSPGGPDVGGEWAYRAGLVGAPNGANQGISSAGLGLFGPSDRFRTDSNLQGPNSINGLEYGITSAGDDPATINGDSVLGTTALIQNSVVFALGATLPGFSTGDISNVSFQYGPSLTDTNVRVPEPTTLLLLGSGLLTLGFWGRRRLFNHGGKS